MGAVQIRDEMFEVICFSFRLGEDRGSLGLRIWQAGGGRL